MQIKEGTDWKAGYNDAKGVYGAEVELFESEKANREQRRKKREERSRQKK